MDSQTHFRGDGLDLLKQLQDIFDLDPFIDELGFVHPSQFLQLNEERKETLEDVGAFFDQNVFWFSNHKLAISVLALHSLCKAAMEEFMEVRTAYNVEKKLIVDGSYLDATNRTLSIKGPKANHLEEKMMRHSKALLLLSCDFATAWNSRKDILLRRQEIAPFLEEFQFSALILSYSPKSEQVWSHRRWLIKIVAERFASLEEILEKESDFVEHICEKYKMNYRAWCHRGWLIAYMTRDQVLKELDRTRKWAELHVADNSCFHYRSRLMLSLITNPSYQKQYMEDEGYPNSDICRSWKAELEWDMTLINLYGRRETVWLHRRFLSHEWMKLMYGHSVYCSTPNEELNTFLKDELQIARSSLNMTDNSFDDAHGQAVHASSYILWILRQAQVENRGLQGQFRDLSGFTSFVHEFCPERAPLWKDLLL